MTKATRRWSQAELDALRRTRNASVPNASPATKAAAVPRSGKPTTPERDILAGCLQLLAVHPKVAWAARQNTGGMALEGRFVKFGMTGAADITGMLRGGRRLEVECKRSGKMPSPAQNAYLFMVNKDGGWACWVDSVSKLSDLLNALP